MLEASASALASALTCTAARGWSGTGVLGCALECTSQGTGNKPHKEFTWHRGGHVKRGHQAQEKGVCPCCPE